MRHTVRWILKCHACFKVTTEVGRIFCPSCGNGGTLRKVAVTVGGNGVVLAAHRPRISLHGTQVSSSIAFFPSFVGNSAEIYNSSFFKDFYLCIFPVYICFVLSC